MESLYLCCNPSPWSGVARIFDFGNTFDVYNQASSGEEADGIGLFWDWSIVGMDLRDGAYTYEYTTRDSTPETARELVTR